MKVRGPLTPHDEREGKASGGMMIKGYNDHHGASFFF